jgi:polyferredoxin
VIRDRGALAREVEDGRIENTYRLQVMNTSERSQAFALSAGGLPALQLASEPGFEIPGASSRSILVRLRARPEDIPPGSNKIVIGVKSVDDPKVAVEEKTVFLGLRR